MKAQSLFEIYDIVELYSEDPLLRGASGKKGIIRGKSQRDSVPPVFAYAVDIPSLKGNYFILESELKPTGKKVNPNQVETDTVISVQGA